MMSEIEKPIGGTELQFLKLKQILQSDLDDFNIMVTYGHPNQIDENRINVLWQHNGLDDENLIKMMKYKPFVEQIDQFIFVSNYQFDMFSRSFDIPSDRCHVIRNAIDPIEYKQKSEDKIKLVYTSTPWRGLGILLEAFDRLNRPDVELDVYSGLKIYGRQFVEETGNIFEPLFDRARSMKGVNYFEYAPNADVIKAVQSCHIMAYPSIFEETSCIAAIESLAAGCNFVGSNLGALLETVNVFGNLVPINRSRENHIEEFIDRYVVVLEETINNFWTEENQKSLKLQTEYFNHYYSWETRKRDWKKFLIEAKNKGKV